MEHIQREVDRIKRKIKTLEWDLSILKDGPMRSWKEKQLNAYREDLNDLLFLQKRMDMDDHAYAEV
ncbi:MAG: hypothetical protein ACOC32_00345 [Nanoarchaeota archaeon]